MALVLDDIVGAAITAKELTGALRSAIDNLRDGLGGNAKEKKAQLTAQVAELEGKLAQVGELASIGEAYARSHEDILDLLFLCRRAQRVLVESARECEDPESPGHDAAWRVLDTLFDAMDLDVVQRVATERQDWYDDGDRVRIDGWLRDFGAAFARRGTSLRVRSAAELRSDVESMRKALSETESLLKSTLYDRILRPLARMRA